MLSYFLSNKLKNTDIGLLVLRLVGGGFMLVHGFPKLMKIVNGDMGFADPIGIGEVPSLFLTVFAEFVCGIALVLGFKTRLASVFLAFTMFVAAFRVHLADPWGKKELALLFFGIYVALILMGGGKLGVDKED